VSGRTRWIATLALLVAAAGCGPPALSPEELAALRIFGLAGAAADEPLLPEWFDLGKDDGRKTALLDALDALATIVDPTVTGVEPLLETKGAIVDIRGSLPGGGSALYSVQVEPDADGKWRIGWFAGPGTAWPTPGRPRDEGLTTSGADPR